MLELTDKITGEKHFLPPEEVAIISESGSGSRVVTVHGGTVWCEEAAGDLADAWDELMNDEDDEDDEDDGGNDEDDGGNDD